MKSPVSVRDKIEMTVGKLSCKLLRSEDESNINSKTNSVPQRSLDMSVSFRKRISFTELTEELWAELDEIDPEPSLIQKRSESLPDLDNRLEHDKCFLLPERSVSRSSSLRSAADLVSKCRDGEETSLSTGDEKRPSRDDTAPTRSRERSRTRRSSKTRRASRSKSRNRRPRSLSQTRVAATVGVTLLTVGDTTAFTSEPTRTAFTRSKSDSSILSGGRDNLSPVENRRNAVFGVSPPRRVQSSTSLDCFKALGAASHMAATISNSSCGSFENAGEILGNAGEMLGNLDAREVLADLETRQILGDVDASILGDLSCIAADLPEILKKGDLAIKVGGLASQILALTADLLPGHDISMDSLAYQILMVASASHTVFQAVHPMIQAALREREQNSIAVHDKRTFEDLFSPAGVTMSQFHALSDSAMEWIDVKPGETVPQDEGQDDQHFYYLYSGNVEVERDGELLYRVERGEKVSKNAAKGLIGEETLIRSLSNGIAQDQSSEALTIHAGDSGAKMLRIKKSKLDNMMDQDKDLSRSMGILVMQSMQSKMKVKREPLSGQRLAAAFA